MLTLPGNLVIYLAQSPVDMRKSIDGLTYLVVNTLKQNPKQSALFVFFNNRYNKIKILYWDRTGFALWYKRLLSGRFRPPKSKNDILKLSASDLTCLLEGIDLLHSQRHILV